MSSFLNAISVRRVNSNPISSLPQSPVPHLLRSNIPPSEQERCYITDVVATVKERQKELQDALAAPNSNRSQIQQAITQADDFVDKHEALLSTLRVIPNELMSLIFIHCMAPFETLPLSRTHWDFLPSFRLSRVCSRWRSIAINTPKIWHMLGNVRLTRKTASTKGYSYAQFLETLLQRSKDVDIWIYVYAPSEGHGDHSHPIIDLLARHSERWGVFAIEASCTTVNAFYTIRHRLPRLRILSLELWRYPQVIIDAFSDAPLLTDVGILGIYPHELILPWGQLTAYRERGNTNSRGAISQVISMAMGLEKLSLGGPIYALGSIKPRRFAHLKILHLRLTSALPSDAEAFLALFTTPFLEELKLAGYPSAVCPPLKALIRRSIIHVIDFPLTVLYIQTAVFHAGDLSALLSLLPRLEDLDINFPPHNDLLDLIAGTNNHRNRTRLVPRLKKLIIHCHSNDFIDNTSTIKVLARSRCERHATYSHETTLVCANDDSAHSLRLGSGLKTFRLVFSDGGMASSAQLSLNGWVTNRQTVSSVEPTSISPSRAPQELETPNSFANDFKTGGTPASSSDKAEQPPFEDWRDVLHKELPELDGKLPSRKRMIDFSFSTRLDGILEIIEKAEMMIDNVPSLFFSRLHFSLLQLSQMGENHIPGDNKYKFRLRAEAVLRNWDPLLRAKIANAERGCVNWALKGSRSLIYILDNDPLRFSLEASRMVYGLEDEMHLVDLEWPDNI